MPLRLFSAINGCIMLCQSWLTTSSKVQALLVLHHRNLFLWLLMFCEFFLRVWCFNFIDTKNQNTKTAQKPFTTGMKPHYYHIQSQKSVSSATDEPLSSSHLSRCTADLPSSSWRPVWPGIPCRQPGTKWCFSWFGHPVAPPAWTESPLWRTPAREKGGVKAHSPTSFFLCSIYVQ